VTVAPERPLANRKFERAEPEFAMNSAARHVSAKRRISRVPYAYRRSSRCGNCARVKLAPTMLVVFPTPLERAN
jgi:hypothetical protein